MDRNKMIGMKIKTARLEAGLTQKEFAEQLGITDVMLSKYENGRSSAHRKLDQIAILLDKRPEYFVSENTERDTLYSDIKELVRLLKEKTHDYAWPFSPEVPIYTAQDLTQFPTLGDSKGKLEISKEIADKYPEAFAIKVDSNFYKSTFEKGTTLIIAPDTQVDDRSFVIRMGRSGLIVGRKASTRGKLIGAVIQVLMG